MVLRILISLSLIDIIADLVVIITAGLEDINIVHEGKISRSVRALA